MKRTAWLFMAALALCGQSAGGDDKGTVVTLDGLKSRTPANWKVQRPSNEMRAYQFLIPRAEGDKKDAELVIFFFGAGSGGTAADNIKRWKGQFDPPQGKTIEQVSKLEKFKVGDVDIAYLDISGTYLYKFPPFAPNAKVTPLPGYRSLGVYFGSKNGPYFIKMTGAAKTVAQNKKGFDDWVKSFK
jgi:hypothetical protein